MSVYKDTKRGTYYISHYYRDPVTNAAKKKVKRGFKTKTEATAYEKENFIKEELVHPQEKSMKFCDVAKSWAEYNQSSSESKRQHDEHFKYRFAKYYEKPISEISKSDLIQWRIELAKSDFSTATKNITIGYVKSVFRFASEMYGISDPSSVLKRLKKSNHEILEDYQVWTPEEFSRFVSVIDDEYKVFFEFLYWTGCRRGEAIALQKSDLVGKFVNIKYSQRDATTGLRPTKTRQRRKIELDDVLLEHLKPLLKISGPYLFGGNHALAPTSIDRIFKRGIEESGVKKIRIHDLRHSHATWLINKGVNIVAVSKRLGHSTIEQTLKTYTHLLETSEYDMMLTLNQYRDTEVIQNT